VSWTVREGTAGVVLRRNGAGKTTLVQLCSAQIHPSSGTVAILGDALGEVDVFDLAPDAGSPARPWRSAFRATRSSDVVVSRRTASSALA